jgi:hypothetical protein
MAFPARMTESSPRWPARRRPKRRTPLAADSPPGTAVVLLDRYGEIEQSSLDAERWLAEHFGAADHPGWLPGPVAEWLALPPRPALVSVRDGRHLTIQLLPGDPHALLLEEEVTSFRTDALDRLGLTPRETEVLHAATAMEDEADIAWELSLSLHAVRERLASARDRVAEVLELEPVELAVRIDLHRVDLEVLHENLVAVGRERNPGQRIALHERGHDLLVSNCHLRTSGRCGHPCMHQIGRGNSAPGDATPQR